METGCLQKVQSILRSSTAWVREWQLWSSKVCGKFQAQRPAFAGAHLAMGDDDCIRPCGEIYVSHTTIRETRTEATEALAMLLSHTGIIREGELLRAQF